LSVTLVIGVQWGDEGKGRIVDFLAASRPEIAARFGGGANAGHTVRVGDKTYKLRIVPSGVVAGARNCIIGPGAAVSPAQFVAELGALEAEGIDTSRVWLSDLAHLILPYHIELDRALESRRGDSALGTTGNGIGPAYVDRVARKGVRAGDLRDPKALKVLIEARCSDAAELGVNVDAGSVWEEAVALSPRVLPHVRDTVAMIGEALHAGKSILVEGAQGSMLDVNLGTYPYVTSSVTVAGGAGAGLGFGPTSIENVIGVAKAYATRVGAGPFPTELTDAVGEHLRTKGREFGVVTGRPRRCGWLDLVALRYVAAVNGLTHLALTKLDVLDGMPEIAVCTGYANTPEASLPFVMAAKPQPVLKMMRGWSEPTTAARAWDELPAPARAYVEMIEEAVGVQVAYVSVGPERSQIIVREHAPLRAVELKA
jgi:adenylosuccinate synthase